MRFRGIIVAAAAIFLVWTLFVYVSVTSRFGDRIWPIGSRVYSDVSVVTPGDPLTIARLAERLDDAGYGRSSSRPTRPGQYRVAGDRVEVYLRELDSPVSTAPSRVRTIEFDDGGVRSLRDERGRRLRRIVLEPLVLATLYGPRQEERELVRLDQVPPILRQAVLAAEDARFYGHHGLDLRGILRAAAANVRSGRIVQGGSTITQQTVKNLYLDQRRTWWRKIREIGLALMLDARFGKDEIFEVYLNEVYLGQRGSVAICGVGAAARFYFGKPLDQLSLAESALLAGLIRNPGRNNPHTTPERAIARRDQVLQALERLGYLREDERVDAAAERMVVAPVRAARPRAPFAVDHVQSELSSLYSRSVLNASGLQIYTTIDPLTQYEAERALGAGLARLESRYATLAEQRDTRVLEGAALVVRPVTGAIVAMVGGRDYGRSQFNRATQARRQPGSCFKPIVFAAGLEAAAEGRPDGLTPATLLEDQPLELVSGGKTWSPANYDREFRGIVTVRHALERSLNVPTVRAAQAVGLDRVVTTARRLGIASPMQPLPSLALGTAEVSPLELATAYAAFAAGGTRTTPWIIRAVLDGDGARMEAQTVERGPAVSAQTAFLLTDMLRGVFERGTARSATDYGFRGEAAGKTGTTDDTRDSWFVGYDDELFGLVWLGYDDNSRTGLTGATGALPIWVELMSRTAGAHRLSPEVPEGVVSRRIDAQTGELARSGCDEVIREYFIRGTEPLSDCHLHEGRFKRWFERILGRGERERGGKRRSG